MPKREWVRKEARSEVEGEEFAVDAIVDERRHRGRRQFLIKWRARALLAKRDPAWVGAVHAGLFLIKWRARALFLLPLL
jgi:hypothetical protein